MAGIKSTQDQQLDLSGTRVLVVEDEYYIADDVKRTLIGAGASVLGPCPTLDSAIEAAAEGEFDLAVIDLNLHGESAIPLADRLAEDGRTFAIATGYGSPAVPERHRNVPRIEKPFDAAALLNLMGRLAGAPTV